MLTQHRAPGVPQPTHIVPEQTALAAQVPLQQGCPTPPHRPQVAGQPMHCKAFSQAFPVEQQGSPDPPQWHTVPTQTPPGQTPDTGVVVQTPLAHPSCVHGF